MKCFQRQCIGRIWAVFALLFNGLLKLPSNEAKTHKRTDGEMSETSNIEGTESPTIKEGITPVLKETSSSIRLDKCEPFKADIVFVIIGKLRRNQRKCVNKFILKMFQNVTINSTNVRIGFLAFNRSKNITNHLNRFYTTIEVEEIMNVSNILRKEMFNRTNGDRENVPKIVIMIGRSSYVQADTRKSFKESYKTRKKGIQFYIVNLEKRQGYENLGRVYDILTGGPEALYQMWKKPAKLEELHGTFFIPKCQESPAQMQDCSSVDSFDCNDGSCVHYQSICDRTPDCSNGFDEEDCDYEVMKSCNIDNALRVNTFKERRVDRSFCFALAKKNGINGCDQRNGKQLTIGSKKMHEIVTNYLQKINKSVGINRLGLGLNVLMGNHTHADYFWDDKSPLTYTAWQSSSHGKDCFFLKYSTKLNTSVWLSKACTGNPWVLCSWRKPDITAAEGSSSSDEVETLTFKLKNTDQKWNASHIFKCGSGEIISVLYTCDNVNDCADGSDETNAKCDRISSTGGYTCNDGTLINIGLWCDFYPDCPDQSDEIDCVAVPCSVYEWKCNSGQCIPLNGVCNNRFDCYDRSDEGKSACYGECRNRDLFACDDFIGSQCISMTLAADDYDDCMCKGDDHNRTKLKIGRNCTGTTNGTSLFANLGDEVHGALNLTCMDTSFKIQVQHISQHYDAKKDVTIFSLKYGSEILIDQLFDTYNESDCKLWTMPGLVYSSSNSDLDPNWETNQLTDIRSHNNLSITSPPRKLIYKKRVTALSYMDNEQNYIVCQREERKQRLGDNDEMMTCKTGSTQVYGRNKCLLKIKPDGAPFGCRDLTHLDACEDFSCPEDYAKCPNSFCLHVQHVCDGQPHCPHGEDELGCDNYTCKGMYKCRNSTACLPYRQVCDNKRQCPRGDDEVLCNNECPKQCNCKGAIFKCHATDVPKTVSQMSKLSQHVRYIDFSGSAASNESVYSSFHRLLVLDLTDCKLTTVLSNENISIFENLQNLRKLDISNNYIKYLPGNSFNGLTNLRKLFLSDNKALSTIDDDAFHDFGQVTHLHMAKCGLQHIDAQLFRKMLKLKNLDLSSNPIHTHSGTLKENPNLKQLDLSGTYLLLNQDFFEGITHLRKLQTNHPETCCFIKERFYKCQCISPVDDISSCTDLISNDLLRNFIWIIGGLALLGNVFVISYRVWDGSFVTEWMSHTVFVTFLGFSDLLMGIYTIIIASVDATYRGTYVHHKTEWRNSPLCVLAGTISATSSEASAMLICLIAIDRYIAVRFPFTKISTKLSVILAFVSVVLAAVIAILPVMIYGYFEGHFYSRSGVCTALPLTRSKRSTGWHYSVGVFIIFNMILFMVVGVVQLLLYKEVKTSSQKSRRSRASVDTIVARSLTVVIITDFLCWFPIGVLGFLSLDGYDIPHEAYAWIVVFVLPINSALNPILYTLSYIRKKKTQEDMKTSLTEVPWKVKNDVLQIHHRINRAQSTPGSIPLSQFLRHNLLTSPMVQMIKSKLLDDLKFYHGKNFCHGRISEETVSVFWNGTELIDVHLEFLHSKITQNMDKYKDADDLESLIKRIRNHIPRRHTVNVTGHTTDILT